MFALIDRRASKIVAVGKEKSEFKDKRGFIVKAEHLADELDRDILVEVYEKETGEEAPKRSDRMASALQDIIARRAQKRGRGRPELAAATVSGRGRLPEAPVAKARAIFDRTKDQPRAAVIRACVEAGVNYHTARTQYQRWHVANVAK